MRIILATILVIWVAASAEAALKKASNYGELFVIEQAVSPKPKWNFGLFYSQEISNPYLNTRGVGGSAQFRFNRFFLAGLQTSVYFNEDRDLLNKLNQELKSESIQQRQIKPLMSTFAMVSVIPLSGHVNFFGGRALEMNLALSAGVGVTTTQEVNQQTTWQEAILWSARPQLFVSENLGFEAGISQEVDRPFSGVQGAIVKLQAFGGTIIAF